MLESEPNDIESLVSRASCHLDLFHFPEAVQDAGAVLEMNGDHAKVLNPCHFNIHTEFMEVDITDLPVSFLFSFPFTYKVKNEIKPLIKIRYIEPVQYFN